MIRRVVVLRWTAEATEEQKQQVAAGLRRLPALLPVLRAYHVGPDLGLAEGNFDFAVVADLDDLEGLQVYRDNPEHRAGPRSQATGNRPAGARCCAAARQPHRGAARPGPAAARSAGQCRKKLSATGTTFKSSSSTVQYLAPDGNRTGKAASQNPLSLVTDLLPARSTTPAESCRGTCHVSR
jgi:Stress responsive A/B Barrel Domain